MAQDVLAGRHALVTGGARGLGAGMAQALAAAGAAVMIGDVLDDLAGETASGFGISPVEIARASLIGQPVHFLSPLVPSTYLLVGLAGVEFGDHQRFTLKWAVLVCLLMLVASLACAVFPLRT